MAKQTIFKYSTGLNTVVDPSELAFDPKTGMSELAVAVNVVIAPSGRVSRILTGYTKLQDLTTGHSLWSHEGPCFVAQGASLYRVGTDYSLTGIRSGLTGDRISYAQDEFTYYSNGTENGIIKEGISYPWAQDTSYGPDSTKFYDTPPIGHHIAFYKGRALVARDNILMWSEVFQYGLFNLATSFVSFRTKILMVCPVESGVFVSDERRTYFLRGDDPNKFTMDIEATYPAYEWSEANDYVEGADMALDPGLCRLWVSSKGAVVGTSTGKIVNLTNKKLIYPEDGAYGASLIKGYDFVQTIT